MLWGYPRRPMIIIIHFGSHVKTRQIQSYKFKEFAKYSNFLIKKMHYTRHTFWSCLIRCVNMKWIWRVLGREREREIKFIGLFENRGHRGPYSPYKPFNHNLYIGIIIFPHIDNPQYTGYDLPKKKPNKIINAKKVRAPLIWQIIGEKDSGSVYMWI